MRFYLCQDFSEQTFFVRFFWTSNSCKNHQIGQAILNAHAPRMTGMATHKEESSDGAYNWIQCYLKRNDSRLALARLYQAGAEFLIGDSSKINRAHAWKTEYIGILKCGRTKGYWALVIATSYREQLIS
jgi:hypothetical protein